MSVLFEYLLGFCYANRKKGETGDMAILLALDPVDWRGTRANLRRRGSCVDVMNTLGTLESNQPRALLELLQFCPVARDQIVSSIETFRKAMPASVGGCVGPVEGRHIACFGVAQSVNHLLFRAASVQSRARPAHLH